MPESILTLEALEVLYRFYGLAANLNNGEITGFHKEKDALSA